MLAAIAVASIAGSGCTAIAIGRASKQRMDVASVDVRVTGRRADIDGTTCYVERKQRVTSRIDMGDYVFYGMFAVLEALVGAGVLAAGSFGTPEGSEELELDFHSPALIGTGAFLLLDGGIATWYNYGRHDDVVTDESWVQTDETATCAP